MFKEDIRKFNIHNIKIQYQNFTTKLNEVCEKLYLASILKHSTQNKLLKLRVITEQNLLRPCLL